MKNLKNLNVKIFADGADIETMISMSEKPYIHGLTTNPTLMRKAGIQDYRKFCLDVLKHIKAKPISFEVFSDDFLEMEEQALEIASWGKNVYVKIPVTNTNAEPSFELIQRLGSNGVQVNVTALMTLDQVRNVVSVLNPNIASYISVFAGRIADTGEDPIPLMSEALDIMKPLPASELIWASPRELLNIFQANDLGCHVITVTSDILSKLPKIGYSLEKYSLDTVKMFHNDALSAGYKL